MVWQIANVVFWLMCLYLTVTRPWTKANWFAPFGAFAWAGVAADAVRSRLRVEDHVLYRHGIRGWDHFVDLDRLTDVRLARVWEFKEPYPHLELHISDIDGHGATISLRWWTNWQPLLEAVAKAVSADSAGQRGAIVWTIDLDEKTRWRLASYL